MCELFCMASRHPATVRFSLEAFSRRGGLQGPQKDGWGLAWYDGADVHLLKEVHPAADSACVRFVQQNPFESRLVISHIRHATQGGVTSSNCQPFMRELGGRLHVFAHNGHLRPDGLHERLPYDSFIPIGTTDSEQAFCSLLSAMRRLGSTRVLPSLEDRISVFSRFAATARALGPANVVYADGDAVFIHADQRTQPDGVIRPPGLHLLERRCAGPEANLETEGLTLRSSSEQRVVLLASVPLTQEPAWRALPAGTIVVVRDGEVVAESVAGR